jgi:signal transduction histidine kinase
MSLLAHLTIRFSFLTLISALAIGISTMLIYRQQIDQQAWDQVGLSKNATLALLQERQNELHQLSILISQRPTLSALIKQADSSALHSYLDTLQSGARVDWILVCDMNGQLIASTGQPMRDNLCLSKELKDVYLETDKSPLGAWLLSEQQISTSTSPLGRVILAQRLNNNSVKTLKLQTGTEQIVLGRGIVIASSLADDLGKPWEYPRLSGDRYKLILQGIQYYAVRFPYGDSGLEMVVSLPVTVYSQTQQKLLNVSLLNLAIIFLLGSLLIFFTARGISSPLKRMEKAALALRQGNTLVPVPVDSSIREISLVAQALEDARITLHHSLAELTKQKAWTDHLLESIVEGIVTLDHLGRVTFFSQGAEAIFRMKQGEVVGQHCEDVFQLFDPKGRFLDILPAPGQRRKAIFLLAQGDLVTLSMTRGEQNLPEVGNVQAALVFRDVTDEEGLRKILGEFLANITHEFRTPLSALAVSVELLLDQLPDLSQAEIRELLESLELGTLGLQTLIDNLLAGASMETGHFRVTPKPARIEGIIEENLRLIEPLLRKYHISAEYNIAQNLPQVVIDSRRTAQVFINLLTNAIKNSPAGGNILINVLVQESCLQVQVIDQGPGIPIDRISNLFGHFVRFETSGERLSSGTGLGLYVVKSIVEAQGGQVGVQNNVDSGSMFWFTLPIYKEGEK